MAQIKVYARHALLAECQALISQAVHSALVSALQYPEGKKFQRFFAMDEGDFIHPADRSERYTIIEVSMFEGRSLGAKRALIQALIEQLKAHAGIDAQDIEITLFETPKVNWGIRGMNGEDLSLGYKVDV
jgi:phenylpyruvate tautomerase PptA (4-oxalocrotonate tautomerase family)